MKVLAIIPARMESSRFPGKPLADIHGMPMIGHCYLRIRMCPELLDTYVATCNKEIYDYIKSIGGKVVMTKSTHERASDRAAEAMIKIEQELGYKMDIVVMAQGDEPMTTPEMITESLQPFVNNPSVNVVNLMQEMSSTEEFNDFNEVKVVKDKYNDAIYFSREPIPSISLNKVQPSMHKQICVIPFKRDYLLKFNKMEQTDLEKIESIDMLRVIENGEKVKMVYTDSPSHSVDNANDLKKVIDKMADDKLMKMYL
jgi:3-deoxy-manno-octulosonate cytidylyltransferase (CMP-KDO synthetase)